MDLLNSGNDDILAAIHKMQAEAQLQETAPKFNLGFKIVVDFDKGTYDCDLSWTLKQSLSVSHQIEDPAQTKLPLTPGVAEPMRKLAKTLQKHGGSMTISTGGKEVVIDAEGAKNIIRNCDKILDKKK